MRSFTKTLLFLFVLIALALSACNFNLAGDVTPPPGWHPTAVPPTPNTADLYPALPPDPAAGEAIYQQQCAKCHGEKGLGDGPQAAALEISPAPIGVPEDVRQETPTDRFVVLTRGRMDEGMPPFANILTERQRWDVLAYVHRLSLSEEAIAQGKRLYETRCLSCHEQDGSGKALVTQKRMAHTSDAALFQGITGSQHEPKTYQGLSEDDRWALVAYLRTLSYAQPAESTTTATPTPSAATTPAAEATPSTEEATPAADTIRVTGAVTNGTQGSEVPSDLEITLHAYDGMEETYTATTKIDAAGHFAFDDVPTAPQRIFFTTAEYAGVLYGSRSVTPTPQQNSIDLPITIYETTTDPSQVRIERLHIFVEPHTDQLLQVVEIYIITNEGDRTLVGADANSPVLTFQLPAGALHLQFQNGALGGRYIQTPDGFGDMLPVYPQLTTQEIFAYDLPFEGKRLEIRHLVPLAAAAAVLMAPEGQLTLSGDGLADQGVQSDSQGNNYHVYNVAALDAGDTLHFTVARVGGGLSLQNDKVNIAIGLMALGATLIAIAVVLTKREAAAGESDETSPAVDIPEAIADDPDALMDAILALDDLRKQGTIDEATYRARRAAMKARLQELLTPNEEA